MFLVLREPRDALPVTSKFVVALAHTVMKKSLVIPAGLIYHSKHPIIAGSDFNKGLVIS